MISKMGRAFVLAASLITPFSMTDSVHAQDHNGRVAVAKSDIKSASPKELVVSANIVLVIDASASVDPVENEQMMEGVRTTLLNDPLDYSECYAMTVVRYALSSYTGKTHIFCSKEGAQAFVEEELSDANDIPPSQRYNIGAGTSIGAGIAAARIVFEEEQSVTGILAQRRAVFFIGDGPNFSNGPLQNDILTLATLYGATSYAVAVADRDDKDNDTLATRLYYRENLVTPAGLTYIDKAVYGEMPLGVSPGVYGEASDFTAVGRAFQYVLQVGRF